MGVHKMITQISSQLVFERRDFGGMELGGIGTGTERDMNHGLGRLNKTEERGKK